MRLIVFADLHLHNWSNFGLDPATGLSKRLVDQQGVTRQILDIAIKEKVDGALCLGDIIHSVGSVSTEVLNTAYIFFNEFKLANIPTYFVPGNHDLNSRKNPKWYNYSCKVFEPASPPPNIKIIGYHETVDYENTKGFDVVAIHKTPMGARLGGYTFEQGFDWKTLAANNKLVLCGHIHQRQHLTDNCIIVGSPMHLTFGDIGERGIYLVDTVRGTAEFSKLNYPEFITVKNYSDTRDDGNYYRALNSAEFSDSLKTENVKVHASPTYLPERIKSTSFYEILKEWLVIQEKPETYLDVLSGIVDEKFELGKKLYDGKLMEVTIENFLSAEKVVYQVENGFIVVLGSNGSGKSSLFEAIYWCLFGKTTKGLTGDDVIRSRPTQQVDCKVTLRFMSKDSTEFSVTRSRTEGIGIFKKGLDGKAYDLCGERKLSDSQRILEDILGFDEKLFRTSCYFSQENLLMLTGLEDANRTKMITDLLGFESYNDLYAQTHKRIETLTDQIASNAYSISMLGLEIANLQGKATAYKEWLIDIGTPKLLELETSLLNLTATKERLESELATFEAAEVPFRDFDCEETGLEAQRAKHLKLVEALMVEVEKRSNGVQNSDSYYKVALNDLSHATETLEKAEKKFKAVSDASEGVNCESCGGLVSKESKEAYLEAKRDELYSLRAKKSAAQDLVEVMEATVEDCKKFRDTSKKELTALNLTGQALVTQISELGKERRKYEEAKQAQTTAKAVLEAKLSISGSQIVTANADLEKVTEQVAQMSDNIDKNAASVAKSETYIAAFQAEDAIAQMEIALLEFWKIAFSPKGIRALLLDKFCNDFNQIVNTYLHEVSDDLMGLMVTPTEMTKGGEERNRIGMTVYFKDYQVKYAALSGGEKRRVDCSLIFGLSKYLETKYNLGAQGLLGILILDEVFGGLDKAGEDSLVALLARESRTKAIFVIDHLLNFTGSADRVWTVSKVDDVSNLDTAFAI